MIKTLLLALALSACASAPAHVAAPAAPTNPSAALLAVLSPSASVAPVGELDAFAILPDEMSVIVCHAADRKHRPECHTLALFMGDHVAGSWAPPPKQEAPPASAPPAATPTPPATDAKAKAEAPKKK